MDTPEADSPLTRVTQGKAKLFSDERGGLGVFDIPDCVPFAPVRAFWITDAGPEHTRGGHAHKACSQFFVCLRGNIRVDAFDGRLTRDYLLGPGDFLNLVPGIFATQTFLQKDAVLLVLCDRPYEAHDYIHDKNLLRAD